MAVSGSRRFNTGMLGAKIRAVGLLAGVLLLLLPGLAGAASPSTTVSLTFDDGLADQYVNALPALSSHGMQGTFYVNTAHLENSSEYMTWAQLHTLAGAGNEIGGHTLDHPNLTTLEPSEAAREICNDRVNLINQGFQPTDFAYPFGAFNSTVKSIVKNCGYDSARALGGLVSPFDGACSSGCPYAEEIPPADPYAIRTPDSIVSTTTLSDLETLVTDAESNGGGWVPIVFHDVCENACEPRSIAPATFSAFLDWLRQQSESGALAVKTVQQVIGGSFQPGVPGPPPTGTSLQNPSLEIDANGDGVPDCWQIGGYGTNTATFTRTSNAHSGSWAEQLTVSNYQSGDTKLVVSQDQGQCSPTVTPGRAYTVSSWYHSTTRMNLVVFYRDQIGAWHYLATSPAFAATSSWTNAQWTTPAMPSTATAISFGPDLTSNGSITFDDLGLAMAPPTVSLTGLIGGMVYSGTQTLSANAGSGTDHVDFLVNGSLVGTATASPWSISWSSQSVPNGPVTITARAVDASGASSSSSASVSIDNTGSPVKNASLEWDANGDGNPDCWQTSGYGTNTFSFTRTSDAHSGGWAERAEITSYTNGDRKLLQTQDSGLCAPAATPGHAYTISTWFKSSIHPYFVVFTRNSSGTWSFWTSSPGFTGSSTSWTQATWKMPAIPAGTTNISYGLDLSTVGFLTVDDFSLACASGCDTTPPSSSASSPVYSTSGSLSVPYTASDEPGGSGLAEVDLYAQAPGQSGYTKVASDTSGAGEGSFSYTATAGDGAYNFYTLATDKAGNVQTAPLSPNTTTLLDTTPPTSKAGAPALSSSTSLSVSYTASDNEGGSGIARVDLYAQAPGQSAYTKVASDTSAAGEGSFSYTATAGDGAYSFYTLATDRAGNVQAAPAIPDATTLLDTTVPTSKASAQALSSSTSLTIGYTIVNLGGSGLAEVDLYAQAPGQSAYTKVASDTSGAGEGSFSYTATAGDGAYNFYTIAISKAGDAQAAPLTPDATTLLDTTPPTSNASAPASGTYGAIPVSYTAADNEGGSGLARVDLYVEGPGQSSYTKAASDTSGSGSGSFSYTPSAGNGTYSFYTVATDSAGNVQAAPATPNATTGYTLDTTPPTATASAPTYSTTAKWTVSYTASDNAGGSGLASVELWVRVPGTSGYVKAATSTGSATSGSFTYTGAAGDGGYAFYTIAVDQAGNRQGPPSTPNATTTLDTLAPRAFQMATPNQYLSGTVKLSLTSAPTDGGSGMASVTYQYRAGGTANAWATACTATASPWNCNWNTKTTPDGPYELRAVAADRAGNKTVASNTPLSAITVENATPTAKSASTANVSGGIVGKAQTGDSMTFTYSTTMNPGSILAGWTGASTPVQVRFVAKTATDTTLTVWNASGTAQLALANPLNLGGNYVPASGAIFNAAVVQSGTSITVTLGSLASGSVQATPVAGGTLTWTPSSGATDLAGNKCSTTSVTALGPAF